jgi:hypothetical protein
MPKEQRPHKHLLLKWYAACEKIRVQNEKAYDACAFVADLFRKANIDCCVLKGQGNAMMYGNPYSRVPGDIDLWVNSDHVRIENGYLLIGDERLKVGRQVYHHFDVESVGGVPVEVHTRPSFMNNLIHNQRMQKWFEENYYGQVSNCVELPDKHGRICIPIPEFNVVYQLAHISKHFFQEGIGLRQFVDYYYVLKSEIEGRDRFADVLRKLGLYKMAQAVMYVEKQVFGLDDHFLIVPEDKVRGQFLLNEILLSGNFGKFDKRIDNYHRNTKVGRNTQRVKRDLRLLRLFPSESLSEPVFRMWHFFWRLKNA